MVGREAEMGLFKRLQQSENSITTCNIYRRSAAICLRVKVCVEKVLEETTDHLWSEKS